MQTLVLSEIARVTFFVFISLQYSSRAIGYLRPKRKFTKNLDNGQLGEAGLRSTVFFTIKFYWLCSLYYQHPCSLFLSGRLLPFTKVYDF